MINPLTGVFGMLLLLSLFGLGMVFIWRRSGAAGPCRPPGTSTIGVMVQPEAATRESPVSRYAPVSGPGRAPVFLGDFQAEPDALPEPLRRRLQGLDGAYNPPLERDGADRCDRCGPRRPAVPPAVNVRLIISLGGDWARTPPPDPLVIPLRFVFQESGDPAK
ncbi:MAG: hypothetical protein IBX71_05520 [Candidatus Desulforudis sp.]|nr:hypothetical protein [Desulforudis sp.]